MKLIYELIITALELLGMVFVAIGLGLFASWLAGAAGFFTVFGFGLLGSAYLAARQQTIRETPRKPARQPVTRSADDTTEIKNHRSVLKRFSDWLYA